MIDAVSYAREIEKGEPLQLAAHVYGVDITAIRHGAAKDKKSKPITVGAKKSKAVS